MKVAKWYNNQDIRIEEVPKPNPGPKEMLVKVLSCGICGSDIVEWYRLPRAPLIPGHEIGAEVVETGGSVSAYKPGDRVFIAPKVPCMTCYYCEKGHYPICANSKARLPGGFSEYVLVPEDIVKNGTYLLPDNITYDQSTFIEPLACVIRAQNLAEVQEGRTVLVIGCGMSGLLHVKLLKSKGCKVIATDINRKKLEYADRFGADLTVDAKEDVAEVLISQNRKKADTVILCASAMSAVEQAWNGVDKGGTVVFFAVPGPDKEVSVPINDFWMKEIKILTTYYCSPYDIADAISLLEKEEIKVDDMITHKMPLEDIVEGFQHVTESKDSIKVIINPT
ncbi:MAG: alcohol dehydrogenase catalytic domain-containing protein [Deltaproteobacteria bacterium]|nr:alcohol dehydrogenase catalytic domain-containing protein [Deltaproteobacteria bacterium]MBW2208535.1 alcohol dehydrogenase catalytic domain-containing protein [Deltaproteobacteria bacterium]